MLNLSVWKVRFREHLELRGTASRTVANYVAELRPLLAFIEEQGLQSLTEVTRDTLEGYRTYLYYLKFRGRRLSLGCQANRICAAKAFFRFLTKARYLLVDPALQVELPKTPQTLPRTILSESEVERLLEAPDVRHPRGLRDRALLEVLYGSAIRNSELGALTLDAVDRERRELRIHHGKGGKSRVVPLGEEAAWWLEEYLLRGRPVLAAQAPASERRVFLTRKGRPLSREYVSTRVRCAAKRAGLDKPITPHGLRHSCATHMLAHGAGLRHLQQLLGHGTSISTERYTRVEVSDLRRVHQRCHPRERRRT